MQLGISASIVRLNSHDENQTKTTAQNIRKEKPFDLHLFCYCVFSGQS